MVTLYNIAQYTGVDDPVGLSAGLIRIRKNFYNIDDDVFINYVFKSFTIYNSDMDIVREALKITFPNKIKLIDLYFLK